MDAPLDPGLVEDCLAIQTKPQEGDIEIEILQRHKEGSIEQKKFKNLDPETKTLPSDTKIYINEVHVNIIRNFGPSVKNYRMQSTYYRSG